MSAERFIHSIRVVQCERCAKRAKVYILGTVYLRPHYAIISSRVCRRPSAPGGGGG